MKFSAPGFVIYRGPSMIDGQPILGLVTLQSRNTKNDDMAQLWIMRADMSPSAALQSGADASVCGHCQHRKHKGDGTIGPKTCYVMTIVTENLWHCWARGLYPELSITDPIVAELLAGRSLRFGAYGEPIAVPLEVNRALAASVRTIVQHGSEIGASADRVYHGNRTGYTHHWAFTDAAYAGLFMASVDSPADRVEAKSRGYRTFRVMAIGGTILPGEIACPASAEQGHRTTCLQCKLCDGKTGPDDRRPDIVIQAHGTAAARIV